MNIVLMEDSRAPIFSSELREKYPRSCTLTVNNRTSYDVLKLLANPPTLKDNWLVIVERGSADILIETVAKTTFAVVLIMSDNINSARHNSIASKVGDTSILNMINIEESTGIEYIKKRINVSDDNAKKLLKLCNGYMPHLEESIVVLECVGGEITQSVMSRYIQRRSSITVHKLFFHLVKVKRVPEKDLVTYLCKYMYAIKYIRKRLLELFNISIDLYEQIESGVLGSDNVEDYCKSKSNLKVSKYFVRRVVDELHPSLDLSSLLLFRYKVDKLDNMITLLSYI